LLPYHGLQKRLSSQTSDGNRLTSDLQTLALESIPEPLETLTFDQQTIAVVAFTLEGVQQPDRTSMPSSAKTNGPLSITVL
jgi:hypothetical protein